MEEIKYVDRVGTTMLEPKALLVSMALAVLIIPVDLIRKAIMRK